MGTFSASLRTIGDVRSLPATVELSEGRLILHAGDTEIGSWALDEINLEEIPQGYRLVAEGEQVLLEFKNVDAFAEELRNTGKRRLGFGRKKQQTNKEEPNEPQRPEPPAAPTAESVKVEQAPAQVVAQVAQVKAPKKPGRATRAVDFVDDILIGAKKRFGAYLPDFMFSRAMFAIGIATLVLAILLPGVFSMVLLILGGLMVLFGAVVYSDSVLASRWLPGRATPQQALLLGLSIFLLGVLIGIVAK